MMEITITSAFTVRLNGSTQAERQEALAYLRGQGFLQNEIEDPKVVQIYIGGKGSTAFWVGGRRQSTVTSLIELPAPPLPVDEPKNLHIKVREPGKKQFVFLSSGGKVNSLRIHAALFNETGANEVVRQILADNEGWEAKVVPADKLDRKEKAVAAPETEPPVQEPQVQQYAESLSPAEFASLEAGDELEYTNGTGGMEIIEVLQDEETGLRTVEITLDTNEVIDPTTELGSSFVAMVRLRRRFRDPVDKK